jgi:hypothetical protein
MSTSERRCFMPRHGKPHWLARPSRVRQLVSHSLSLFGPSAPFPVPPLVTLFARARFPLGRCGRSRNEALCQPCSANRGLHGAIPRAVANDRSRSSAPATFRQGRLVELRVGSRSRNTARVDDALYTVPPATVRETLSKCAWSPFVRILCISVYFAETTWIASANQVSTDVLSCLKEASRTRCLLPVSFRVRRSAEFHEGKLTSAHSSHMFQRS